MTKRDRPTEDEIEVTDDMIAAGVRAYSAYYADLQPTSLHPNQVEVERRMVRAVFTAMAERTAGS
jgi:hypothetical protein